MSKVMETITFPGGAEPYQVRDGRIPETPGNYQYLVTDGNGQWGTAERLAWETVERVVIQEGTVGDGPVTGAMPGYTGPANTLSATALIIGDTYIITMDGTVYTGVAEVGVNEAQDGNPGVQIFGRYDDFSEAPLNLYAYSSSIYVTYEVNGNHSLKIEHLATVTKPIDPAKWLPEGYPYGEEHSVILSTSGGVAFEGEDKGEGAPSYYLVYAGTVSDEAWDNLTVTKPSGEKLIDANSGDNGNTRYFRDDDYYYTVLCRFDGTRTVTNSTGTITPAAGIYWRMGYNETGGNGFTATFGFVQTMAPKFLPMAFFIRPDYSNADIIALEKITSFNADGSVKSTEPLSYKELFDAILKGTPIRGEHGENFDARMSPGSSTIVLMKYPYQVYEPSGPANGNNFETWRVEEDGSATLMSGIGLLPYALYLNSSTEGSQKVFQIKVDDSGAITATEVV